MDFRRHQVPLDGKEGSWRPDGSLHQSVSVVTDPRWRAALRLPNPRPELPGQLPRVNRLPNGGRLPSFHLTLDRYSSVATARSSTTSIRIQFSSLREISADEAPSNEIIGFRRKAPRAENDLKSLSSTSWGCTACACRSSRRRPLIDGAGRTTRILAPKGEGR